MTSTQQQNYQENISAKLAQEKEPMLLPTSTTAKTPQSPQNRSKRSTVRALASNDAYIKNAKVSREKSSPGYLKRISVFNPYEKISFAFFGLYSFLSLIGLFLIIPLYMYSQNLNWGLLLGIEAGILGVLLAGALCVGGAVGATLLIRRAIYVSPEDKVLSYDLRYAPNVRINGKVISDARELKRVHTDSMERMGARYPILKQSSLEETEYVVWQQDIPFWKSLKFHLPFFSFFALECLTAAVGFCLLMVAIVFLYPVSLPVAIYLTFQATVMTAMLGGYFLLWRQLIAPNLNVSYILTSSRCIRMSHSSVYQVAHQDLNRVLTKSEAERMSRWGMQFLLSSREKAIVGEYKYKSRPALFPDLPKKRVIIFPEVQPDIEYDYVQKYMEESVTRDSPRESEIFLEEELDIPLEDVLEDEDADAEFFQ